MRKDPPTESRTVWSAHHYLHLKLGLIRLGQRGFVEGFAVARGLRRDKLGLFCGDRRGGSFS
jgi:hypothetical protein